MSLLKRRRARTDSGRRGKNRQGCQAEDDGIHSQTSDAVTEETHAPGHSVDAKRRERGGLPLLKPAWRVTFQYAIHFPEEIGFVGG